MNEPIDPISVRQGRQGKPVLVILTVSLVLAIMGGAALWVIMGDRGETDPMEMKAPLEQTAPASPTTG